MPRRPERSTEMIRLPADVVRALRHRAATADITLAEAARQLMLPKELGHQLDLENHVVWLHDRLLKRRDDLTNLFDDAGADSGAVGQAIDALMQLHKEWPEEEDGYDFAAHGGG